MLKMNEDGIYQPFPGVTLISKIKPQDIFWDLLYKEMTINPLITTYYGLLPSNSYHMTINNLYTKYESDLLGENWNKFISTNQSFWRKLYLETQQFNWAPQITIQQIISSHTLHLILSIPLGQVKSIKSFSSNIQLEARLPYTFHITLGHKKQREEINSDDKKEIEQTIISLINKLFPSQNIELLPSQLCYFNDMTEFTPWDGKENPFLRTLVGSAFFDAPKKCLNESEESVSFKIPSS